MNKTWLFFGVGVVALLVVIAAFALRPTTPTAPAPTVEDELQSEPAGLGQAPLTEVSPTPAASLVTFGTPKKSAHFESSTPAHGTTLPAPPINVVLDFNFDLAPQSFIAIERNGGDNGNARDALERDYGMDLTTIDANKLSMRRKMDPSAPDGLYTVTYQACWPDGSCHDGHFQFAINRTKASAALDLRGQSAVTVNLKDIAFAPPVIRIRQGTRVTWRNDDSVEHYVNTDAHPSHTYFLAQNSRALKNGDTYAVTFSTPGAYPYHCSAHADTMRGLILVE
ncbi:MAG: Blue (Type1) copper protein [Parcubacteria group bacterium Gr01-1014_38]|nr:MAG: Blue (Type1) copper protein [Parcubacteria group bacterium Gr01-1014_38]